jgi:hypothetical protein
MAVFSPIGLLFCLNPLYQIWAGKAAFLCKKYLKTALFQRVFMVFQGAKVEDIIYK